METKKRTEKDRISAVLFIVVFLLVVVIVIMVLKTVDDKRAQQQAQEQQTINTMTYQPPVQDPGALVNGDNNTETPQNFEAVTVLPNSNSNSGGYTGTGTGNTGGNGGNGGTGNGTGTGTGTGNGAGNGGGQTTQPMPTTAPANNPAPAPANQPTVVENPPAQPAPETAQYTPTETLPTGNTAADPQPVVNFTPYRLGSDRFDGNSGTWLNVYAEWTATAVSPTQVDINITLFSVHQSIDDPAHDNNVHFSIRELGNDQNIQFASMGSPRQRQAADNYAVTSTQIGTYTFTVDVAQGETKTFIVDAAWDYGGTYGSDKGRVKIDSLECGGGIQISR